MTRPVKISLAALVALALIAALAVAIVAQRTASQATQRATALATQLHDEHAQITALAAKATGPSRDVITCQDWQRFDAPVSGTDSAGGTISAWSDPPALPTHCVNR